MSRPPSFYRDERRFRQRAKETANSDHRAFDLALFFDADILIIEAKAQQSFGTEQLEDIQEDPELVKLLTGVKRVRLSALVSSRYSPSKKTKALFTGPYLTWKDLAGFYGDNPVLRRADEIYRR